MNPEPWWTQGKGGTRFDRSLEIRSTLKITFEDIMAKDPCEFPEHLVHEMFPNGLELADWTPDMQRDVLLSELRIGLGWAARVGLVPLWSMAGWDLSGADLKNADLMETNMVRAKLTGSDLTDARLDGANLGDADLTDALLAGADFTDARLEGALFTRADMAGATLAGANLKKAGMSEACLSRATLVEAALDHADFTGADLEGAVWPEEVELPHGWKRSGGLLRREQ